MQIGMVGLGRMGASRVKRLQKAGHTAVVYDVNADAVKTLEKAGATASASLEDFVEKLDTPRVAWLMLPTAPGHEYDHRVIERLRRPYVRPE